jgi:hypothetical protein
MNFLEQHVRSKTQIQTKFVSSVNFRVDKRDLFCLRLLNLASLVTKGLQKKSPTSQYA